MTRWLAKILCLGLLITAAGGCSKQAFLLEKDWDTFKNLGLKDCLETDPRLGLKPLLPEAAPKPINVRDTEREPRYLTLSEAIASALENGLTGIFSVRQPGQLNDDLLRRISSTGALVNESDSNRVLSMNPARAATAVEAALSRFDTVLANGIIWRHLDDPNQGLTSFNNGDSTQFSTSLVKPLPTGGIAGITFSGTYQYLNRPPSNFFTKNPTWEPQIKFVFEHPLWQSYGIEINQLLPEHPGPTPGSELTVSSQAALGIHNRVRYADGRAGNPEAQAGILITRIRFDQSRAELEIAESYKLLNVETAYWNLYGAYVNLYAAELALRQVHAVWRRSIEKAESGSTNPGDYLPTLGQYELFRGDRLQAMGRVLEAERVLRGLMGFPAEDGTRLVPVDPPTIAPYIPDWESARTEALNNRPELVAARQELKVHQLNMITLKNFTKPDLKFLSAYSITALGTRLDGNGQEFDASTGTFQTNNALRGLASNHYNDFTAGFIFNVPLGYRFENAAIRNARLQLAQHYFGVKNEELRAERFLVKAYRDLIENHDLIAIRRNQRLAYAKLVDIRTKEFQAGKEKAIEFLLEAERQFSSSLTSEFQAIVAYNTSLAAFEFAKGTLLQYNNVQINEGLLPECALERATEHERQRTKSIVIRERANIVPQPDWSPELGTNGLPMLPEHAAPSIYSLQQGAPELPKELGQKPLIRKDAQPAGQPPVPQVQPQTTGRQQDISNLSTLPPDLPAAAMPTGSPLAEPQGLTFTREPVSRKLNFEREPLVPSSVPELPGFSQPR